MRITITLQNTAVQWRWCLRPRTGERQASGFVSSGSHAAKQTGAHPNKSRNSNVREAVKKAVFAASYFIRQPIRAPGELGDSDRHRQRQDRPHYRGPFEDSQMNFGFICLT
jgi:hypothetical protein